MASRIRSLKSKLFQYVPFDANDFLWIPVNLILINNRFKGEMFVISLESKKENSNFPEARLRID